jgi:hypothetical protein
MYLRTLPKVVGHPCFQGLVTAQVLRYTGSISRPKLVFRLRKDVLAVSAGGSSPRGFRSCIPAGSLITIEQEPPADPRQLVAITWDRQRWRILALDLIERGEQVQEATSGN